MPRLRIRARVNSIGAWPTDRRAVIGGIQLLLQGRRFAAPGRSLLQETLGAGSCYTLGLREPLHSRALVACRSVLRQQGILSGHSKRRIPACLRACKGLLHSSCCLTM